METPKLGKHPMTRNVRKRLLEIEFKAVDGSSDDEIFATNLMQLPALIKKKKPYVRKTNGSQQSAVSIQKRKAVKRKSTGNRRRRQKKVAKDPEVTDENKLGQKEMASKVADTKDAEDESDGSICKQLQNISIDEPELPKLTIDPGNFRPVELNKKYKFKFPKLEKLILSD